MQLSPSAALVNNPLVVRSMVLIGEAKQKGRGALCEVRTPNLIGQGQQEEDECGLVLRFGLKNVETNAFGLRRLIQ